MEPEKTDERLVEEFRAGDPGAFGTLVERYKRMAYGLCFRMLKNHHAAEDASQEAFVRAFRGLPGYRGEAPFRIWFGRILAHVALNGRRATSREPQAVPRIDAPEPRPPGGNLDEFRQRVDAAVRDLPEKQRLTLILRVHEGRSFEEIAEILDTTPPAARVHLSLARKALHQKLGREIG